MGSIYSRTRVATDTHSNRDLALLDIDKLISFDLGSLHEQGERVKYMRMVAGLMNQSRRMEETPRGLDELVRLARHHFESVRRRISEEEVRASVEESGSGLVI